MIRYLFVFISVVFASSGFGQTSSDAKQASDFTNLLLKSDSLHAVYHIQTLTGLPKTYKVDLSKPDKARIEDGDQIIIADGTKITHFYKATNQYYYDTQKSLKLKLLFEPGEYYIWRPFFDQKGYAFNKLASIPTQNRAGVRVTGIDFYVGDANSRHFTIYFDPMGMAIRQAELETIVQGPDNIRLLGVDDYALNKPVDPDLFTFHPGLKAKEATQDEILSGTWYSNYDEAMQAAKRTKKLLLIAFYSDAIEDSRKEEADVYLKPEFKDLKGDYVFVRLEGSRYDKLTNQFKVSTYPTVLILDAKEEEVGRHQGYLTLEDFLQFAKDMKAQSGQ
jgi:hypothetical protein